MPETVAQLPPRLRPTKGETKYKDFDKYMDGNTWKFTQGIDFQCKPASFGSQLMRYAKTKGLKGACRPRGLHLFFQITDLIV